MNFSTTCIHGPKRFAEPTGSVVAPIYPSSSFAHPGLGQSTGYDYSRTQNPTRQALEDTVCALEGGDDCLAFSTGMAAIDTVFDLFGPGDAIVTSYDLYGGSIRLFGELERNRGLKFVSVDTADLEATRRAIAPGTRAVYIESPTNPTMGVTDIAATAQAAHDVGAVLIVDNTFLTPYFCRPIALGADIVVHSGTKYLGGHNDVLCGFAVSASAKLSSRLRYLQNTTGAVLSPFDSWLVTRGLKTLPLRMEQHQRNALGLARWFQGRPEVAEVLYPGLPERPDYSLSLAQTSGFGGVVSVRTRDRETAVKLIERTKLVLFAESLGGTETLITYPLTQTHADLAPQDRAAKGIDECLVRISVGLESLDDLVADFEQALA